MRVEKYGLSVLGSSVGKDTAYLHWDLFRGFPQSLHANSAIVPMLGHYRFLPSFLDCSSVILASTTLQNVNKERTSICALILCSAHYVYTPTTPTASITLHHTT
jgi:hypothetical protein